MLKRKNEKEKNDINLDIRNERNYYKKYLEQIRKRNEFPYFIKFIPIKINKKEIRKPSGKNAVKHSMRIKFFAQITLKILVLLAQELINLFFLLK